ncbi:MAG TPA: NfeD family protein [Sphingomicrobium sp.]|jgi:membrane protein implicated in regulation of membrane protease activity
MNGIDLDPEWLWLIGGVVLLIAELVAPGFWLAFVGVAAIATGVAAIALPIGVPLQLALFAALALLVTRVGSRRFYAARYDYSANPHLNDRVHQMLGRVVMVVEPVNSDGGRVRVGDSVWSARGSPASVGERVRIVDVEGNCLKVEPEHALPPS